MCLGIINLNDSTWCKYIHVLNRSYLPEEEQIGNMTRKEKKNSQEKNMNHIRMV